MIWLVNTLFLKIVYNCADPIEPDWDYIDNEDCTAFDSTTSSDNSDKNTNPMYMY
jgi:hypothetical protein